MILKNPKTGEIEQTIHHCAKHFLMFSIWIAQKEVKEKIEDLAMVINAKRD